MSQMNLTVLTGPMRSRKTLDLIMEAERAKISGMKTLLFYPAGAERWGDNGIISSRMGINEDGSIKKISHPAIVVPCTADGILEWIPEERCFIGFDDTQFFTNNIVNICRSLLLADHKVVVSGLDMDCFMQPFGPMPYLMALADKVIKRTAICVDCKEPAQYTYRLTKSNEQCIVGDEEYIPLCLDCYKYRSQG